MAVATACGSFSRIARIPRQFYFLLFVFLAACQVNTVPEPPPATTSNQSPEARPARESRAPDVTSIDSSETLPLVFDNLWDRIRHGLKLQAHYQHEDVQYWIANYAGDQRFFDLIAERAEPFLFYIVDEVETAGLPAELALLPVVESTFDPNAYSAVHAVGLWQFLGPTARSFGLQLDWWYDGRRDPHASTEAAIAYLSRIHAQFDENWLVAIGAYNTGSPNMRRAIRRSGQSSDQGIDFWSLPLAPETRAHVPKLLAIAAIVSEPANYGIELPALANANPLQLVEIGSQIDLAQAARLAEIDYEQLRHFNNGYRQWATHPDTPQRLYLPPENAEKLQASLRSLPADQFVTWDRYEIQSGDTLGGIASKLGTSVDVLRVVNRLSSSRIIAGRSLLIPRGLNNASDLTELASLAPTQSAPPAVPDSYRVRAGDNLWSIARRFQLRSQDIARHNGFALDALLMPGQVLDLSYSDETSTSLASTASGSESGWYRVRSGDSLARIARRLGLSVLQLLDWNGFANNEIIYPDQRIRVQAP